MRFMTSLRFIESVAREKSIRKAAEKLAITSTALNRRILQIEDEIGQPLFERLPSGVRLNTAGEIFVQHIRTQTAELARVQSQISDLSGIRRGHVKIAGGSESLQHFLPGVVANYRAEHPAVTFNIIDQSGDEAEASLRKLEVDLAMIFEPIKTNDFQTIVTAKQKLYCIMAAGHPLTSKKIIKLRDCLDQVIILPPDSDGISQLLKVGMIRRNIDIKPSIETNSREFLHSYLAKEQVISFQISIAMPTELMDSNNVFDGIVAREVDPGDVPTGIMHVGHLKGRVLPVAAAKFLDTIISELRVRHGDDLDQ